LKAPRAEVSQVIDAGPARVYEILSDYRTEHPRILPKPYFASLVVEEGGQGEGTVFRAEMNVMGVKQTLRMRVTEPEPGRVLQEEDSAAGVTTTFTVTPLDGGRRSRLTIATTWAPKPGIAGCIEGMITPPVTRRIYKKELDLLNAYAKGTDGNSGN